MIPRSDRLHQYLVRIQIQKKSMLNLRKALQRSKIQPEESKHHQRVPQEIFKLNIVEILRRLFRHILFTTLVPLSTEIRRKTKFRASGTTIIFELARVAVMIGEKNSIYT